MKKLGIAVVMMFLGLLLFSCGTKTKDNNEKEKLPAETGSNKTEKAQLDTTLIFHASLEGNVQTVLNALDDGFKPNTIDENGRTVLMLAAYNGNTEIVKLLIDRGTDVNSSDEVERTALMYASTGPFVNTVLALLKAGAEPNLIEKEESWTAAMMAAAEGQLEVLKTLVAYGADLDMVDIDGESSLDFAKSNGHSAVVEYIKSIL